MTKEKEIKKVSKGRQEYLKFKPFADDLRKAESWCELDGVLNRYQTVKNLSKMGYRKSSEVALESVDDFQRRIRHIFLEMCCGNDYNTLNLLEIDSAIEALYDTFIAELKKKYTEEIK